MTEGNFRVMFPRVKYIKDYAEAIKFVEKIKEELISEGKVVNNNIEFGSMVELVSFVQDLETVLKNPTNLTGDEIEAKALLEELVRNGKLKFISDGTNDLTRNTLMVSRISTDAAISGEYDELAPEVLGNIEITVKAANKLNIDLSVCGDMGNSIPEFLMLLALGIRKISVGPAFIDIARRIVRSIEIGSLEKILKDIKGSSVVSGITPDSSRYWEIQQGDEIRKFIAHSLTGQIKQGNLDGLQPILCLVRSTPNVK
jgi:phosphoenolpyruvate-protein kinase (PTS system EI component)